MADLVCLALVDGFSLVQDNDSVQHGVEKKTRLVDGEDYRVALVGQLFEDLEHSCGFIAVQA